ncbi:MAG: SDR family oxidoreductase, partial [Microbacteriaceae bacterium]|nr:SDR family oxidoreductase [Microbacteriaceae bacterium]
MTANHYEFTGKTVLVTGAGSGIGQAIAQGFLENGARVVVAGRRANRLTETIAEARPGQALAVPTDVADRSSVDTLVARTISEFGSLDVVVSNAALYASGPLSALSEEEWHRLFQVNVDGLYHLVAASGDELVRTKGNLVAVSSVSGSFGDWGQAAYNSTKHAVTGLIR